MSKEFCCLVRVGEVYCCNICGSLTNKAGYTHDKSKKSIKFTLVCPNDQKPWHNELLEKVEKLEKTKSKSRRIELQGEILELRRKVKKEICGDVRYLGLARNLKTLGEMF